MFRVRTLAAVTVIAALSSPMAAASTSPEVEFYLAGDYEQVRRDWSAQAAEGDPVAMYNLGMLYVQGLGAGRQPERGLALVRRAAVLGYPPAQYRLALDLYRFDIDVGDASKAAFWLLSAARQGHAASALYLGRLYLGNHSGVGSAEQALYWLRLARDSGESGADRFIARLEAALPVDGEAEADDVQSRLKEGSGTLAQRKQVYEGQKAFVAQDYATAVTLWAPLAEAGVARAQYGIAFMLESGWGVIQDYAEAAYWYQLAAQKGHRKAQFNLGVMYMDGRGVEENRGVGLYWIQTAADLGEQRARDYMERNPSGRD